MPFFYISRVSSAAACAPPDDDQQIGGDFSLAKSLAHALIVHHELNPVGKGQRREEKQRYRSEGVQWLMSGWSRMI
jgi:hypothetical protein